jgi:hypothetical protein
VVARTLSSIKLKQIKDGEQILEKVLKVNNHTIKSDVPANAKFTDTTYETMTAAEATAGTGTTARVITAKVLADKIAEAIASLVDSSPAALDTLNELAAALNNDPNFATTMATALGNKLGKNETAVNAAKVNNLTVETAVPANAKFTDTTYSNFVKSGSTAAAGLVPAPSTTAGTTKYLREDGTWQVPPDNNTTYTAASATPLANGTAAVGTSAKYAREDHVHPLQTSVSGSSGSCTGNAATASKAAQLTTARTIDGVSFNGTGNIKHYAACSTAAATAEKVVVRKGFTLVVGARIEVKFTVTNTAANPTLNVNSTGAKAIYYRGAAISAGYLAANRIYTFIYNGTQYDLVGDLNTDTNNATAQNISTANATYPILLGNTANATANIGNKATLFSTKAKLNPSTGQMTLNGKVILVVSSFDPSTGTLNLVSSGS